MTVIVTLAATAVVFSIVIFLAETRMRVKELERIVNDLIDKC